eukprot:GHVS01074003.1.p1 GENE.GHVS01074003.1~~GHVS01074003.1.p1  ORF type:complete len:633 (+),score=125.96 GHVS01074003.1:439-2337(+)
MASLQLYSVLRSSPWSCTVSRLLLVALSVFVLSSSTGTCESSSSVISRILVGTAAPGVPQSQLPTSESVPRFAEYRFCNLSAPEAMLGLPLLSSEAPPSAQAVWVAYYSRVIVAEHQPKELPLVKLYCAAMAARKLLYRLDASRYSMFAEIEQEVEEMSADEKEQVGAKLKASVEAGHEVESMLLHPDVFDVSVVKALMTLGWQEMKFYETSKPVWMEWLEDEDAERDSWIDHMDSEIERIDGKVEKIAYEQMRVQLVDRMREEEQEQVYEEREVLHIPAGAGGLVDGAKAAPFAKLPEAVDTKSRNALFRRLGVREQMSTKLGRLDMQRKQLEGARLEMEKVNDQWRERVAEVLSKWEKFVAGAFKRVERSNSSGGESWEGGLEWIAKKYREDPKENRDVCEGYLLEMVLDVNEVNRINGRAWRHQAAKNQAFAEVLNKFDSETKGTTSVSSNGGGVDGVEEVTRVKPVNDGSTQEQSLIESMMQDEIEADVDWLVNEMLQDVDGLDIDVDELIDQLVDMNEESLYAEILEAAGGPDLAEAALAGMMEGVDEIVNDMIKATEVTTGVDIDGINDLADLMMRGDMGQDLVDDEEEQSTSSEESSEEEEKGATTKSSVLSPEEQFAEMRSAVM